jgi:hypothetical protein
LQQVDVRQIKLRNRGWSGYSFSLRLASVIGPSRSVAEARRMRQWTSYCGDDFTIALKNLYAVCAKMQIRRFNYLLLLAFVGVTLSACSNDNSHTTAITKIAPPPHQTLIVVSKPAPKSSGPIAVDPPADHTKPLLSFNLQKGRTFRVGEEVPIEFSVQNAKLKSEGGEFRVRYIVDDDEVEWLDTTDPIWLTGWIPGKHTIRIELIGPDGWPYKNGNANIVTREINVMP